MWERSTSAPTRACPAFATLSRAHLVWQASQALISRNGTLSIVHEVPPEGALASRYAAGAAEGCPDAWAVFWEARNN